MKNIVLFVLALTVSAGAAAQTASNFSHTDIDGNSHTLYDELDNGNIVVIKFFTDWCPNCHNSAGAFINLHNTHHTNGDQVVFWAMGRQDSEGQQGAIDFDGDHNFPFPVFGQAQSIATALGVQYQPEYRVIRPDRSYTQPSSVSAVGQHIEDALASLTSIDGVSEQGALFSFVENGRTTVSWDGVPEGSEISIIDVSGKLVYNSEIEESGKLSDVILVSGIYTAVLNSPEGIKHLKFTAIR